MSTKFYTSSKILCPPNQISGYAPGGNIVTITSKVSYIMAKYF